MEPSKTLRYPSAVPDRSRVSPRVLVLPDIYLSGATCRLFPLRVGSGLRLPTLLPRDLWQLPATWRARANGGVCVPVPCPSGVRASGSDSGPSSAPAVST